jgi:hypothetical protein
VELDEDARTLARLAGLGRALDEFPDDVAVAAQTAAAARKALRALGAPSGEPWPAMRMKEAK